MRRACAIAFLFAALLLLGGTALAQDAGTPDTVRAGKVTTNAGQKVGVPVTVYNDNNIGGYSLGFTWNSPDVTFDSMSYIGTRLPPPGGAIRLLSTDLPNRRILVGFADLTTLSPLTSGDGLLFRIWFSVSPSAPDQFIAIDSTFVPPAGRFEMSPQLGLGFSPNFKIGEIKVGNPQPPAIIQLSQTSFTFNGLVGQGNPASQLQNITNIGGQTLNWTSSQQSTWLVLNPTFGTAPTAMVVSVNTNSLAAGTYKDTVSISAGNATNSPQKFAVTLNMTVPPPTIKVLPDSLYFQGLEAAANPASQDFAITNIGQGTLNWTATESAGWINLSSTNGTAPSTVTVSIDNTGLTQGVYVDSVLISDPTATNSPRKVKVVFQIFSAFPVIAWSPDSIFAIASETSNPYNRTLYIENDGGGIMNWTISKKRPWLTLSATSGTAEQGNPGVVTLSFDRTQVDFGQWRDTITITSSNAGNSPQRVPVIFWKMESPQNMFVNKTNMQFNDVECGSYPGPSEQTFTISQAQIAPTIVWNITHKQPWLVVTPSGGASAATVHVRVEVGSLAVGTYNDTIVVSSDLSIDPPRRIAVKFIVSQTPFLHALGVSRDSLLYLYKFTQLGSFQQSIAVFNHFGGCVEWNMTPDVPWLTPVPASGTTMDSVAIRADAVGMTLGPHYGNIAVNGPTATNTPFNVKVVLWIYTFGDANGNGIVNISDVVYLVNWIFSGGPAPVPLPITGDVNCDRETTISDCVYLINWIFADGPPPCLY